MCLQPDFSAALLKGAHDVLREARVQQALAGMVQTQQEIQTKWDAAAPALGLAATAWQAPDLLMQGLEDRARHEATLKAALEQAESAQQALVKARESEAAHAAQLQAADAQLALLQQIHDQAAQRGFNRGCQLRD